MFKPVVLKSRFKRGWLHKEAVSKACSRKGRYEGEEREERNNLKTITSSLRRFSRRVHCVKF